MGKNATGRGSLISAQDLAATIGSPDLRVLDATWRLPGAGGDPRADYEAGHIPGALFVDLDEVSDASSPLPHMAPTIDAFAAHMRSLGVGDGHRVVVYDADGIFSAARVWWLFQYFGVSDAHVLDGGLPAWRAIGGPVEDLPPQTQDRHFAPSGRNMLMRDVTNVAAAVKLGSAQIVDARPAARFRGEAPEPRPGLRAGRIPGAVNLPYDALLTPDGRMKPPPELRAAFAAAGADLDQPVITSCGSGVTAAIVNLALDRLGKLDHALYDGSWAEWGASPMLPFETG